MTMNRIELIDKKLDTRSKAQKLINKAKAEKRRLNKTELQKFEALRNEMKSIDEEIRSLDNKLTVENRNMKQNKKDNIAMFSITNVIRSKVDNTPLDERTQNAINGAAQQLRDAGLSIAGVAIPLEVRDASTITNIAGPISGDELNVTVSQTQGASTVHKDYQNILAPVFSANVLSEFDTLTGLVGEVAIPRYNGASAFWKGELKKADSTTLQYDEILATPKRLTAYIDISKRLLMQSSEAVETHVREQIVNAVTRKLQQTILGDGAGDANTPAGLFAAANLTAGQTITTYAGLVNIEKLAEKENVTDHLGYIINPDIKATLRTTLMSEVAGAKYIYDNNEVLGQHTVVSNDAKGLIFGDLKQIVICQWGALDMVVDPYTLAQYDAVRVTVNAYFDVINRAPLSGEGKNKTVQKNIIFVKNA